MVSAEKIRCAWCSDDPLYIEYHDNVWGVPLYDAQPLFEMLTLESMQAGLSWITVLKKRENFRKAFAQFDPEKLARFTDADIERCMQDPGIIRNRLKITSVVNNARMFLALQDQQIDFSEFVWQFVGGTPVQNAWRTVKQVPVSTPESDQLSRALKKVGFKFIGTTTMYAFMQATGMVNDHTVGCFRYNAVR